MSSRVQKSYGLRDEAVSEPGGVGPDAVVPSAVRQQAEQFLAGVFDDQFWPSSYTTGCRGPP